MISSPAAFHRHRMESRQHLRETVVTDGVTHPVGAYYGALPLIVGTLAAIALIIAVPVSWWSGTCGNGCRNGWPRLWNSPGTARRIPSVVGLWGKCPGRSSPSSHRSGDRSQRPDVPVRTTARRPGQREGMLVSIWCWR